MQNVMINLLLNGLTAALLLATIVYCLRLNARIKILQDSKSELAHIIREFDESTKRATQSIADIHAATNRISENIQHKIDKANFLADDLQYMIERGQKVTGKVDPTPITRPAPAAAAPVDTRPIGRSPAASSAFILPDLPPSSEAEPARTRLRSRAEQEIMSALSNKKPSGE